MFQFDKCLQEETLSFHSLLALLTAHKRTGLITESSVDNESPRGKKKGGGGLWDIK